MADTTIDDDVLGLLTWNDQLEWWEGQAELMPGHLVGISVSVEDDAAPPTEELALARRVLLRLREREEEARLVAAEELLTIYNDEWNDDAQINEEEFMARLTLDDIAVAADGSAELYYQDDNLFAGHTVMVSIGSDGNFTDADIAGVNNRLMEALRNAFAAQRLLATGEHLLVAVSGGPDSLSLLHALHAMQDEIGLAGLDAAHLDHGLRGPESAAEAEFVAAFCIVRDIPYHLGYADTAGLALARKISTQQAAREARYEFLETTAGQINADKIATGHTQDDQVETVLFNILRGTGLDGLRGIPIQRGPFIRPLLGASRTDVMAYCEANALVPRFDPSNLATDHYTRNRLRWELLPQLERDFNPAVRQALLRLSQITARDVDYIHQEAQAVLPGLTLTYEAVRLVLDANKLRELHPALLRHVLRAALDKMRGTLEGIAHDHVEAICAALNGQRRLPFGITTPSPHCACRVTPRRVSLHKLQI